MEVKIFEIKTIHDESIRQKILRLTLFTVFLLFLWGSDSNKLSIQNIGDVVFSIIFILFALYGIIKMLFPRKIIFRTFIDFQSNKICYKVLTFHKQECILYSDIKNISIVKSKIILELPSEKKIIKLGCFSTRLIRRIKLQFKHLDQEISKGKTKT